MLDIMIPENLSRRGVTFFSVYVDGGGLNTPQRMSLIVL